MQHPETILKAFQNEDIETKYSILVSLFSAIKDKNENCLYIYTALKSNKSLFDATLMDSIYEETIDLYAEKQKEQLESGIQDIEESKEFLYDLAQKESYSKSKENIESLLDSI